MSRRPKFILHDCFEALDTFENGYLTKEEFRSFLAANEVYYTDLELSILVSRYDRNFDGRVTL